MEKRRQRIHSANDAAIDAKVRSSGGADPAGVYPKKHSPTVRRAILSGRVARARRNSDEHDEFSSDSTSVSSDDSGPGDDADVHGVEEVHNESMHRPSSAQTVNGNQAASASHAAASSTSKTGNVFASLRQTMMDRMKQKQKERQSRGVVPAPLTLLPKDEDQQEINTRARLHERVTPRTLLRRKGKRFRDLAASDHSAPVSREDEIIEDEIAAALRRELAQQQAQKAQQAQKLHDDQRFHELNANKYDDDDDDSRDGDTAWAEDSGRVPGTASRRHRPAVAELNLPPKHHNQAGTYGQGTESAAVRRKRSWRRRGPAEVQSDGEDTSSEDPDSQNQEQPHTARVDGRHGGRPKAFESHPTSRPAKQGGRARHVRSRSMSDGTHTSKSERQPAGPTRRHLVKSQSARQTSRRSRSRDGKGARSARADPAPSQPPRPEHVITEEHQEFRRNIEAAIARQEVNNKSKRGPAARSRMRRKNSSQLKVRTMRCDLKFPCLPNAILLDPSSSAASFLCSSAGNFQQGRDRECCDAFVVGWFRLRSATHASAHGTGHVPRGNLPAVAEGLEPHISIPRTVRVGSKDRHCLAHAGAWARVLGRHYGDQVFQVQHQEQDDGSGARPEEFHKDGGRSEAAQKALSGRKDHRPRSHRRALRLSACYDRAQFF